MAPKIIWNNPGLLTCRISSEPVSVLVQAHTAVSKVSGCIPCKWSGTRYTKFWHIAARSGWFRWNFVELNRNMAAK